MKVSTFKKILVLFLALFVVFGTAVGALIVDRTKGIHVLDRFLPRTSGSVVTQTLVHEESNVISIVEKASPSVVTVSIQTPARRVMQFDPFGGGFSQRTQGGTPEDIGSGFVVKADGLIVTNKHVVQDTAAKYKVITNDGTEYEVTTINRDPANDLAILKVDAQGLIPLELGSSDNLKVGQSVIAIGTALGQFRHTVTTGVVSGLGRGITAGDAFQGFAERLDDVIQTDAAINPGNSGGPLLNSAGQVIGINVAVAEGAQNVGFALPVNVLQKGLAQFDANGSFASKAFLGIQYQMLTKQAALLNNVPQGAYVKDVVAGSPAEKAGIKVDDIVTDIDGEHVSDNEGGLSAIIGSKAPDSTISVKVWRESAEKTISVNLTNSS